MKYWQIPRIWEGGECWILGGGPSLPREFGVPESLIEMVMKKKEPPAVYSPYLSPIHRQHIIGVNVAFQLGTWIDFIFFGDGRGFLLPFRRQLASHPAIKVCCDPTVNDSWIKIVNRDLDKPHGISTEQCRVSWNHNSGAAAINFAYYLGCKRVILVGFDMKLNDKYNQHWHDLYGRQNRIWNRKDNKMKNVVGSFDSYLRKFPIIAEDARHLGLEIINASPDSKIKEFPKVSVKQLLQERGLLDRARIWAVTTSPNEKNPITGFYETADFVFYCPACETYHGIWTTHKNKNDAIWEFDNNLESPTIKPSLRIVWKSGSVEEVCHLYIRNGRIEYLKDCTHRLAGKTVEMLYERDIF